MPVEVLITVDTEVWPLAQQWPQQPLDPARDLAREFDWYFHGGEGRRGFGVPWQLATLREAELRATYFIDPLFSFPLGLAPLRDIVAMVEKGGQEVGLHLHPEWLADPRCDGLPAFRGPLLAAYPLDEQRTLVERGLARLREAGATRVDAFRAGGWGANRDTLRALAAAGVHYDTSLNLSAASFPDLAPHEREALQAHVRDGVVELPVTRFADGSAQGRRPLHVCAASFDEFRHVLEHAEAHAWRTVVIVLHSFEFVRVDRMIGPTPPPHRWLARRFARLCRYLAANRSRFPTRHFRDLDPAQIVALPQPRLPRSSRWRTLSRSVAQVASLVY